MKEKYNVKTYCIRGTKGYEIRKIEDNYFTVKELRDILENLINEGKENYTVHHEGFCCGTTIIDISETKNEISID